MNKIKRSGRLLKAGFAVLMREKKLLLFPLIAVTLTLVAALFFIVPVSLYFAGHNHEHWHNFMPHFAASNHTANKNFFAGNRSPLFTVFFSIAYFPSMFLATFCNVAFYYEIMQALNGQPVSIRRGYRLAITRWKAILLWSLFAGLIGFILNMIEQRLSFLGKAITGFIGIAWSVASIFVIPTLVRDSETNNPITLLRRSASTLKNTWGELIIGFVRVELALVFAGALLFSLLVAAGILSPDYFLPLFLFMLPLGIIGSVINRVYCCALFVYATEGVIPEPFDKELLDSAWKVK